VDYEESLNSDGQQPPLTAAILWTQRKTTTYSVENAGPGLWTGTKMWQG